MPKRTYSIVFKKEVVRFMQDEHTALAAGKYFIVQKTWRPSHKRMT
jgi:hypothetical protein